MTIHHIFANRSNVGDWLSARGIQRALGPVDIVEHRCDTPFVAETIRALDRTGPEDFIIIGGGGLFLDYFTPFWRAFEPIGRRVPFCLWGVGCCAEKDAAWLPSRDVLERIIARSRLCYVRDELSRQLFSDQSLPAPVACPALLAVPRAENAPMRRVLHVDHYSVVGAAVFDQMEKFIRDFAKRTRREHANCNNRIREGDESALQAVIDLYASADVIVSSRLHGCILGLASGRRVIAVSGDRKVDAFMNAAGLGEWVCDARDVDRLPDLLGRVETQRTPDVFLTRARHANHAIAGSVRQIMARAV